MFGYFFGPRFFSPGKGNVGKAIPQNAICVGKFGDLGMIKGEWPVIGVVPDWNEKDWPMPPLARLDELENRGWVSDYDERTFELVREREIDPEEVHSFVPDRTMGYGAVEIRLTKLPQRQMS